MKRLFRTILCLLIVAGILGGCKAAAEEPQDVSETSFVPVRPQDDYYRAINEETIKNAVFEYEAMTAGSYFDQKAITDQVKEIVKEVAEGGGYEKGSEEDIIKTAYDKFLEYDFKSGDVPLDLIEVIKEIDSAGSVDELLMIDARLVRDYGIKSIFNMYVGTDYLNSGSKVLTFGQIKGMGGASFKTLDESYGPLDSVKSSGSTILQALGHDKDQAEQAGLNLGYMVMDIYNSTDMEMIECDMDYVYFKEATKDEIKGILTNADLDLYLSEIGYDPSCCDRFGIYDKGQLKGLNDILTDENLDGLKTYELMNFGNKYSEFIAPGFEKLVAYTKSGSGTPEEAIDEIMREFSDETDILYVERYYDDETDKAIIGICDDVKEGYRELISGAGWLSEDTREGLLRKLDNIIYVTGADAKRHGTDGFKYISTTDYYHFLLDYNRLKIREEIASLGKPADRKEISMEMQVFNACYDPSLNNITITAAITSEPFYDKDADYYTNLGGIGSVIAHEMGHAFDSNCILFDENGVYDPAWISKSDVDKLEERNEKAVRYFEDNFTVFGIYHVDGERTLGENYADLGGMECITLLAKTKEDRVKVFENYAKIWCIKMVDTEFFDALDYDVHSPELIRTNAVLATLDAFYETYDVKEGDGMYIAPEDRISRWY